jgi:signal transduction histidine kinase
VKDGKADDPKVPQFLGVIERELGVCTKIISDLLDFARERAPEMSPTPLRGLIENAIGVIPNPAGVELLNEVPDDLPVPNLDKDQFRQVIVNLIQNAVEAIPAETKGRVLVTATVNSTRGIRLTISDNGPGIPKETLAQIFEPLFTTKTKGTGLGLAIVHSVLRRHGAEINVESEMGKGTTFHVDIAAPVPQQVKAA